MKRRSLFISSSSSRNIFGRSIPKLLSVFLSLFLSLFFFFLSSRWYRIYYKHEVYGEWWRSSGKEGVQRRDASARWNATRAVIKTMRWAAAGAAQCTRELITSAFNYIRLRATPRGLGFCRRKYVSTRVFVVRMVRINARYARIRVPKFAIALNS